MAKIKSSEIEKAEKRYQELIAQRDKWNASAKVIIDEKKTILNKKQELISQMRAMKPKKEEIAKLIREHKRARNEYQKIAKGLIAQKKEERGKLFPYLPEELEMLKSDVQYMEMEQQIIPMPLEDENVLIKEIKAKRKEISRLEKILAEQGEVKVAVDSLDKSITELFQKADEEHAIVMKYATELKEYQEKFVNLVNEIAYLINEVKKKNEEIDEIKKKANEYHEKAMEMRKKILSAKKEKWEEIREAKREIEEVNVRARKILTDEKKKEEVIEKNLEELLRKGKLTL